MLCLLRANRRPHIPRRISGSIGMSKRKRPAPDTAETAPTDFHRLASKFDTFVRALDGLIEATPTENFSTRHLTSDIEDRAVIAKVLKRMRLKGQLSWMNQYLQDESTSFCPTETGSFTDTAPTILDDEESRKKLKTSLTTAPIVDADDVYSKLATNSQIVDVERIQFGEQTTSDSTWPPQLPVVHDQILLKQAFTHRSYATACAPAQSSKVYLTSLHNERLEFLGDSFLNHSVTKMLFASMPDAREGEMSLLRAELIGNNTAAEFGRSYGFDKKLLLNDSAERDGVRKTPKVIADTFEAYLGALILDGRDGLIRADNWLKALMRPRIVQYLTEKVHEPVNTFAKQCLWNHMVRQYPSTVTLEDGIPKAAISIKYEWVDGKGGNEGGFVVAAKLNVQSLDIEGRELGRGFGLNKKEAEHRAAMEACKILGIA